ncbi:hypothetical protein [Massilia arenae]|uniref:hypothetical protein n=1 Tax=Massilia arenae TaxID=2603288 RepID=UPI001650386F|nr:hypothetical protein [Massilia arenae]
MATDVYLQIDGIKGESQDSAHQETTEACNRSASLSSAVLIDGDLTLRLPLHYDGGNLGLSNRGRPKIHFIDDNSKHFLTDSVEWLLKNIDSFAEGRSRDQPLACAAIHFGLDAHALFGRDQLCDLSKSSGEILLANVSYEEASWARDEFMRRPEWTGKLYIRYLGRFRTSTSDNRYDGPLILLRDGLTFSGSHSVGIRSHYGYSRIDLAEALSRLEQFSHAHQTELLMGVSNRYRRTLTITQRTRLLKTRPTKIRRIGMG